ncbi:reversion-inducing cysteine-rich protein with Kazal motifs isoform X1 [Brienomyrus brachyistius]|uniref:reversion-inducing cysteine-rich protein with Kazal motifs isoform X1 n=2 Tax=Brienomyrus brachyistius TaxID=42636 RepID=UPI0020B315F9|nr:reversion-inducing cysteine-rich protein with Kazal motifs isoform X1 [Brienomyrus brachyistius]
MFVYFEIILFSLAFIVCDFVYAQDSSCCHHAAELSPCREACEQLPVIKSESRLKHLLQRLPSYCPESMHELWICINSTLPGASRKLDSWVGLGCCELAISADCRRQCTLASSKNDIIKVCKKDSEKPLYSCITKNEMGSVCCSYAGRHTNCREFCQAIFRTDSSPSVSQIKTVKEYCQDVSPQLIGCVGNYTKSYPIRSPVDSLFCCDRAEDAHCQSACRRILRTRTTEQEIIDELIAECRRQPLPQDPLWQCFLGSAHSPPISDPDPPSTARVDCAKLHCCSKANTSFCREECQEVSTNWGSQTWQEFDQMCEYNPVEAELVTCLADIREPCQLGCKDLTYCTNFNNRPTELFRSCNAQSDQGAMNDIKLWSNGSIHMPFMSIPVLDIRRCRPEMWKAVACSLQIKPCYSKSRGSIICRSDCVDILTQCGDRRRFQEGQTPERICDMLSPTDDPERCIPLERYLSPSTLKDVMEEVLHPCNPNPCPLNQLCEVNRKGCRPGQECLPYLCVPGCKLCEGSEFLVHMETLIQVPSLNGQAGCYELCVCGQSGRLESCMEIPCVDTSRTCTVGGQRKNHGTSFMVDCQPCSCYAGDVICSKRQCLSTDSSEDERRRFTGLPCHCPDQFVPVCAWNGRTYPSACVARCMGLQDSQFQFGSCRDHWPCSPNPCPKNQRCIPKRRVCLSNITEYPCRQYECVSSPLSCDKTQLDPACDAANVEHSNLCLLYQRGKTPAYMGHCQDACRLSRPVCGHNGETYTTVCEAYSDRVAVDYHGRCHVVGTVSEFSSDSGCGAVRCPPLSTMDCNPVTPPGACCPLCAGMLRIVVNSGQMDVFAKLNDDQPVTVHDILRILRLHVSVPQCDVFGYLSIDSEIVILIVPVDQQPTPLQIEACSKEAEKIDSLINYGSPSLMSHVPLSAFLTSEVKVSTINSSGLHAARAQVFSLLLMVVLDLGGT